jgi:hypothetical protein
MRHHWRLQPPADDTDTTSGTLVDEKRDEAGSRIVAAGLHALSASRIRLEP